MACVLSVYIKQETAYGWVELAGSRLQIPCIFSFLFCIRIGSFLFESPKQPHLHPLLSTCYISSNLK